MMAEMFLHGDSLFDLLPNEMVVNTLIFVDADTLSNCRLVCKKWQQLIDTNAFQEKAYRENEFVNNGQGYYSFSQISSNDVRRLDLPWYVFYIICKYDPFHRNLVKNHCGQDGLTHWECMNGSYFRNRGGRLWSIEQIPQRECSIINDSNFDGHTTCFSSHEKYYLTKSQKIILKNYGLNKTIIETLKPQVEVSTFFKCLSQLETEYSLIVNIFNPTNNRLQSHFLHDHFPDGRNEWKKISCLLQIEENVSYFHLSHFIQDRSPFVQDVSESFKVTCSVLKILLPLKFKSA